MCRSIKQLRQPDIAASSSEIRAAALQFVRKISGYHHPSRANSEVFSRAVDEITTSSERLLLALNRNTYTAKRTSAEPATGASEP